MPKYRGKSKPEWVRTRATEKQRKTIWGLASIGKGIGEIGPKLELKGDPLNRDTISQVIEEAIGEPGIPPEMVSTLPPVVQAWILEKRPDIKDAVRKSGTGRQGIPSSVWVRHWEDLAEAAGKIVGNLEILLLQFGSRPSETMYPMYEIDGNVVDGGRARMDEVAEGLCGDLYDSAVELKKIDGLLASGLISHLALTIDDWRGLTKDTISRELMHELRLAAKRRTFEGTCQICAGWSR